EVFRPGVPVLRAGPAGRPQGLGAGAASGHAEVAVGALLALALTAWFLVGGHLGAGSFGPGAAPWRASFNVWGVLSGLGLALGLLLFYLALELGKAAVIVPLTALYPVVAVLLSVLFLGERLTWVQWSGLVLALAGILLLVSGPVEGATPEPAAAPPAGSRDAGA
ncbi:MAG: EamA family transporter, partial [Alphaproteobacteria bacterium]